MHVPLIINHFLEVVGPPIPIKGIHTYVCETPIVLLDLVLFIIWVKRNWERDLFILST